MTTDSVDSIARRTDNVRRTLLGAAIVAIVAAVSFAPGVTSAPIFADETAYVSQSYYFDLLMSGRRDDWSWVEYHAYDLPPLPKYVFGAALRAADQPMPDRLTAGAWFRNIEWALVPEASIRAARWPVVAFGIAGCLGVYWLGVVGAGRLEGLGAGLLLAINPLYRLHAHRAMSDVPAESLMLLALASGLTGWTLLGRDRGPWRGWSWMLGAGTLAGLAALAKLNGVLAAMVLAAWSAMGVARGCAMSEGVGPAIRHAIAAAIVAMMGTLVFIILNPYVLARPTGLKPAAFMAPAAADAGPLARLDAMFRHRIEVSDLARERFPHNALNGPLEKLAAVAVQGFGRFGPLGPLDHDSRVAYDRFEVRRDWGAIVWLPLVIAGAVVLAWRGWREWRLGEPPVGWALPVMAGMSAIVVTAFIPLAWDRYYLSLQPPAALLGATALVAAWRAAPLPWRANRG